MAMRELQHRRNNAYDTICLVVNDTVVGSWRTDCNDRVWSDYQLSSTGDGTADWSENCPDCTDPQGYGELMND